MSERTDQEKTQEIATLLQKADNPATQYNRSAAIAALSNNGRQAVAHNFDMASEQGQLQLLGCQLAEPRSIWKEAVTDAEIVNLVVSQFEQVDRESGEVVDKLRTLFVTKSGEVLSSNSPACARFALQLLQSPIAKNNIEPPLKVKFRRLPTLDGGTCLTCTADPNEIMSRVSKASKVSKSKS